LGSFKNTAGRAEDEKNETKKIDAPLPYVTLDGAAEGLGKTPPIAEGEYPKCEQPQ